MNENEFRDMVYNELKKNLPNYIVKKDESLLYKLFIDARGKLSPSDLDSPKRGQLAFQTDILIKNDKVPLVVIETKYGGFSTHDVLTYSTKAMKHKEVYPYIRYGFVIGGESKISKKFFTHNSGFDFAFAIGNMENDLKELIDIVKKQIQASELMLAVLTDRKVRKYVANIELA
ncbi:MAG: hypothetical protein QXQ94_08530 [Candidatus Bathyarchaeia archaeon]